VAGVGRIQLATVTTMTLSSDARVAESMVAGQFLGELKALMEDPESLL